MNTIKSFPFTPTLGWSASRYDLFSLCKRKYYYRYYGKYDPDVPIRRIDELKGLRSVPMAIGTVTHTVIEKLLTRLQKTSEDIDRTRFTDFARGETEVAIRSTVFHEFYYRQREAVTVDDLLPKVEACLENLLSSDRYRWLVEEAIDSSDRWVIDPPGYGESRMEDLKVYFKVDFLFPVGERLHILDWKTGRPDEEKHRKQLVGYSAWAVYHFEIDPDDVRPAVAYLHPEYREVEQTFTERDLMNFAVQVQAETREMHEFCRNVSQNIPLDKEEFPRVDDERICSFCEFRGLCFPDQYPMP